MVLKDHGGSCRSFQALSSLVRWDAQSVSPASLFTFIYSTFIYLDTNKIKLNKTTYMKKLLLQNWDRRNFWQELESQTWRDLYSSAQLSLCTDEKLRPNALSKTRGQRVLWAWIFLCLIQCFPWPTASVCDQQLLLNAPQ